MDCGRAAGAGVGFTFHMLRCVHLKEVELFESHRCSPTSGAVFIFIAAAAPNKASLGTTNGFAQLSVSIMRAVGPALASSMYSLSIDEDHHYMNGGLVYYVTVAMGLGAIWAGSLLPKHPFKDVK